MTNDESALPLGWGETTGDAVKSDEKSSQDVRALDRLERIAQGGFLCGFLLALTNIALSIVVGAKKVATFVDWLALGAVLLLLASTVMFAVVSNVRGAVARGYRPRFSLRGMMIAMTVVAVVLGLVAAMVRG